MNAKVEKLIGRQVLIWAISGPFLAMVALLLMMLRAPTDDMHLPMVTLVGLAVCFQWRTRGLAIALGLLIALVSYHFVSMPTDDRLWLLGVIAAIALSFVVTALSFEEVEAAFKGFEQKSLSHTDNLTELDQQLKAAQLKYQSETQKIEAQRQVLEVTLAEKELQIDANLQMLIRTRDELVAARAQNDSYEQILNLARGELSTALSQNEKLLNEVTQSRQQTNLALERLEATQHELAQNEANQNIQKAVVHEMSDHIETLTREKGLLAQTLEKLQNELMTTVQDKEIPPETAEARRIQGMYLQLRQQFDEKCKTLDETRRELFCSQEKLLALQREYEEVALYSQSEAEKLLELELQRMERERAQEEKIYKQESEALQEIITTLLNK